MNDFNILIIEDESLIAHRLKRSLEKNNYTVIGVAKESSQALNLIHKNSVHLIISDITILGHLNGIETVELIQKSYDIPAIFLTAHKEEKFLKQAVHVNFMGYLVKPYLEEELLRTVKLAYFHFQTKEDKHLDCLNQEYSYNFKTQTIMYEEEAIALSKNEKIFLHLLILNKNQLVSNEQIEALLWNNDAVDDVNRRHLLFRLRKKVPQLDIQTIKGEGYKLVC